MATMSYSGERTVRHARAGFSLMEIMIAVMILGIVGGMIAPKFFQMLENAKKTTATSELKTMKSQITLYKSNMGSYPPKLNDLVNKPKDERAAKKWQGPYLDKVPEDPWNNKYHYKLNAEGSKHPYDLLTYGSEGKGSDKKDWISAWDE